MAQIFYIDKAQQTLVLGQKNFNAAPAPSFYQSNAVALQLFVLDPTYGTFGGTPYVLADCNGLTLRVAVGATPSGTSGWPQPLVVADTWTWDSVSKSYSGTLSLGVEAVANYIGGNSSKSAVIEATLEDASGNRATILQTACLLKAVVDDPGAIPSLPVTNRVRPSLPLQLQGSDGKWFTLSLVAGDDGKQTLSIAEVGES